MARLLLVALALQAGAIGCTVQAYPGPRRSGDETAFIDTTRGIWVERIDHMRFQRLDQRGHRFEVLPGNHVIEVWHTAQTGIGDVRISHPHALQRVCFEAKPRGLYLIEPRDAGDDDWVPVVRDGVTMARVHPCDSAEDAAEAD